MKKKNSPIVTDVPRVESGQNWLNLDLYRTTMEYPKKPVRPKEPGGDLSDAYRVYANKLDVYNSEMYEYNKLVDKYNADKQEKYYEFQEDALRAVGLDEHEAKNRAFDYAWEQGHAYGYSEVWLKLQDIARVILGN